MESESGEGLRGLLPLPMMDDSRSDEGVKGALFDMGGDRMEEGSRLALVDTDVRLSFIGSPPGGESTAGHKDLSSGRARPILGSR